MKKNDTKMLAMIIILSLLSSIMIAGCSSIPARITQSDPTEVSNNEMGKKMLNGIDISKKITLNLYMVGDTPKDLQLVNDEVNKLTVKDLNCTVHFNMTSWSDYMQRYNLLLSSGQEIDLIFTSEWLNYNQFAKKGAFQPLDELVPRYAPALYEFIPEKYWEGVKVDDHIYTIPATWREYVGKGLAYREDYREKYNLPEPNSLENIEAYLEGVKNNEPSLVVTGEGVSDNGFGPFFSATEVLDIKYKWIDLGMPYGLVGDYDEPSNLWSYWGSMEFIEDMKLFKRWADKGFWTKSAVANNSQINAHFTKGITAAALSGVNPVKFNDISIKLESIDSKIEVGFYPYARSTKLAKPVHPIHNGMAIPKSSKNPERALMLYEKLVLDKSYNYLTEYGIEGTHYTVDEGKYYHMLGNSNTNGFQREALNGWAWRNPEIQLFDRSFNEVLDLFKEFDTYSHPDIFLGFAEDYTPYQAERAALFQVQSQYLVPLQAGFVEDVDEAVNIFLEKAKQAGLEKIQEEYIRQWKEYCNENNIK